MVLSSGLAAGPGGIQRNEKPTIAGAIVGWSKSGMYLYEEPTMPAARWCQMDMEAIGHVARPAHSSTFTGFVWFIANGRK
jgi:hypothetical protein